MATAQKIRVNAASVKKYGTEAQEKFAAVRAQLQQLVDEIANVHYEGPNAAQFKKECSDLAVEFSQTLLNDIQKLAEAVRTSTSQIAKSLGGQPITIEVNSSPISPRQGKAAEEGVVDVDPTALRQLIAPVKQRFSAINEQLNSHLKALRATDWTGNAKDGVVSAVSKFTSQATKNATEGQTSITNYINDQVEAALQADQ